MLTRRAFNGYLISGGATLLASPCSLSRAITPRFAAIDADQSCDLLIKDGTVIDPEQQSSSRLDVAVKDGKVLQISPDISVKGARRVISAKGKIVTPGLIDVHVHVYEGVGLLGVNADHYCLAKGVTTAVDSGSAGYATIAGFRKYVVDRCATRVYASMDSGALGLITFTENLEWMNPQLAAEAAERNKPAVVAITVRLSKNDAGTNGLEILRRAREASDAAHLPIMVHAQGTFSPLSDILRMMRKGDVLTHCFHDQPYGLLDDSGKLRPEVRDARERGVFFSVGHGSHFSFKVAAKCLEQDFLPDAISSDIEAQNVNGPVFDLPTTLSKFLLLGLPINKVIELATFRPAHIFDFKESLGSLRPGQVADLAIFALREGSFPFTASGERRMGRQRLISAATIREGTLYINRADEFDDG